MTSRTRRARAVNRSALLLALTAAFALQLLGSASAFGAVDWHLTSISNSTVAPGGSLEYLVQIGNEGDESTNGENVDFTATFPAGLEPTGFNTSDAEAMGFSCAIAAQTLACEGPANFAPKLDAQVLKIVASADPGAGGMATVLFEVAGGGAPAPGNTADPVRISAEDPGFGIDAFDGQALDAAADPYTRAAGHPAGLTSAIDFNTHTDPVIGPRIPVEDAKDVEVDLPPGLVGGLAGVDACTAPELTEGTGATHPTPLCPPTSQVGVVHIRTDRGATSALAVYNMVPPPTAPARFGFNVAGTAVVLDASLVGDGGAYHLRVSGRNTLQGIVIVGASFQFWGVPSDPIHTPERSCAGETPVGGGGLPCLSDAPARAVFRNPTSCSAEAGLVTSVSADSWLHPGVFQHASFVSHLPPGYPFAPGDWGPRQGIEGCGQVPFEPTIAARPTTDRADSPTGLAVDLGLPADCWGPKASAAEAEAAICQSDMKEASVTLPQGLALNPAAASGRAACTPAQAGVTSPLGSAPVEFDGSPVSCPDASKVGSVEIRTPLLEDPIPGYVYLAQQSQNPFGSLLAMYLVAEVPGVRIKQAGQVTLSPGGQLTTSFASVPQTPFSDIHVELYGGQRAVLRTPAACGPYTTTTTLTPWSGNAAAHPSSSFQVTEGCGGGFDPKLDAGTRNPLAGSFSPFGLRLTREDGMQEIAGLAEALPPGLIGAPAGIPYCPDSVLASFPAETVLGSGTGEEAHPSCPAASRIGTVTVGAGAGADPFYTSSGRAYLAGPYHGAPLSIAVLAPAVAGPFDLGTVLVRNAVRVDPESARISVASDPLPTVVHGIPLDLRDIRVDLDRPDFTLNPTSCEPAAVTSEVTSAQGALAHPSSYFQAAGCDRLGFKPRLALKLSGGTRRSDFPGLTAVLRPRLGNANAARIQVALPHSEFLAEKHIKTICTRVQFAADACPPGSVYGKVRAISPLVDYPLEGDVYLRSSSNPLPDMVLKLKGPASQPIEVDAVGRIDSFKGGIRTTFASVPDAPLTKVVLRLPAGKKSLLENSRSLCRSTHRAEVRMDGQNGKAADSRPVLRVKCAKRGRGGKRQRR